jgi:hypothetical protein
METFVNGFLAIVAEYPFGAGILLTAGGYGVYRWRKPTVEGTEGMNGGAKRIYAKLDKMSAASESRAGASEERHNMLAERVEVVAGHTNKIYSKLDDMKDELHIVQTEVAVLSDRSSNRRASDG